MKGLVLIQLQYNPTLKRYVILLFATRWSQSQTGGAKAADVNVCQLIDLYLAQVCSIVWMFLVSGHGGKHLGVALGVVTCFRCVFF